MTSISEFSDTPQHTIKTVCNQTGILPVTLRAWERRYEILSPLRSSNRYRMYSDRDIAILRWLKSRLQVGVSISAAAVELRQLSASGAWPEALPVGSLPESEPSAIPPAKFARELYQALTHHDEVGAGDLFRVAQSNFDLKTIISQILTPCLVEIGEAWYRGNLRMATEHFASGYIRGKLLTLLQSYPNRRGAPLIMVGSAPSEQHEIGALMMAVMLRSEGYRIEYLGPDLPLDDLVEHARYEKPALIILTATTALTALEMKRMQEKLSRLRSSPLFGYGGFAFVLQPELVQQVPGIFLGKTMDIAMSKIAQLLGVDKKVRAARKQIA